MDLDTFTPAGGGSLRDFHQVASEPVATFTQTRTTHPDEIWHPLGGELDQGRPPSPGSSADSQAQTPQQAVGKQGRPAIDADEGNLFPTTARMVRSALRGAG